MCTLTTIEGIKWEVLSHNGRVAFFHGDFSISHDDRTGWYLLRERQEAVFAAKTTHECLAASAEYIWDHLAEEMQAMWLCSKDTEKPYPFMTCPSFFAELRPD